MKERLCNLFEACESPEAPLCPIQESTVKRGVWYPDEPVCQAEQFQYVPWIKKQHQIAALKLTTEDGFFTVRMIEAIRVISSNLKGADPDDSRAESKWLKERIEKRAAASEKRQAKKQKVTTKKKAVLPPAKKKGIKTPTLFKM